MVTKNRHAKNARNVENARSVFRSKSFPRFLWFTWNDSLGRDIEPNSIQKSHFLSNSISQNLLPIVRGVASRTQHIHYTEFQITWEEHTEDITLHIVNTLILIGGMDTTTQESAKFHPAKLFRRLLMFYFMNYVPMVQAPVDTRTTNPQHPQWTPASVVVVVAVVILSMPLLLLFYYFICEEEDLSYDNSYWLTLAWCGHGISC